VRDGGTVLPEPLVTDVALTNVHPSMALRESNGGLYQVFAANPIELLSYDLNTQIFTPLVESQTPSFVIHDVDYSFLGLTFSLGWPCANPNRFSGIVAYPLENGPATPAGRHPLALPARQKARLNRLCSWLDPDRDGDGRSDGGDKCPSTSNATQQDVDHDGLGDACDDCIRAGNPDQIDTDADGYENPCDPDYDQSGRVGIADFNGLRTQFGNVAGVDPDFDPEFDANADGAIGLFEFNVLRRHFGASPGPSAFRTPGARRPGRGLAR
jgi:hypothetical protein